MLRHWGPAQIRNFLFITFGNSNVASTRTCDVGAVLEKLQELCDQGKVGSLLNVITITLVVTRVTTVMNLAAFDNVHRLISISIQNVMSFRVKYIIYHYV
jgi:hypothetical protein